MHRLLAFTSRTLDPPSVGCGSGGGVVLSGVESEAARQQGLQEGQELLSLSADDMEYDVSDINARALVALLSRRRRITLSCAPTQVGATNNRDARHDDRTGGGLRVIAPGQFPLLAGGSEQPELAGLGMHGWAEAYPVLELRQLLCDAEVDELHRAANELRQLQVPHVYDAAHDALFLHAAVTSGNPAPRQCFYLAECPIVRDKLIPLMRRHWPSGDQLGVRCVEYHSYRPGGCLLDPDHIDAGSIMTLSLLLSDPGLYDGGEFMTFEAGVPHMHMLQRGDGVLFMSEKVHNVAAVMSGGPRHALVIEMWEGVDNTADRHA